MRPLCRLSPPLCQSVQAVVQGLCRPHGRFQGAGRLHFSTGLASDNKWSAACRPWGAEALPLGAALAFCVSNWPPRSLQQAGSSRIPAQQTPKFPTCAIGSLHRPLTDPQTWPAACVRAAAGRCSAALPGQAPHRWLGGRQAADQPSGPPPPRQSQQQGSWMHRPSKRPPQRCCRRERRLPPPPPPVPPLPLPAQHSPCSSCHPPASSSSSTRQMSWWRSS